MTYIYIYIFFPPTESKSDDNENLPSMDTLEISKKNTIQSFPSYFGGEDEDNIPEMDELEDVDNLIETDPVSFSQGHFYISAYVLFFWCKITFFRFSWIGEVIDDIWCNTYVGTCLAVFPANFNCFLQCITCTCPVYESTSMPIYFVGDDLLFDGCKI